MSTPANDVTAIFDYHEQTKHHFQQYARSSGSLDWANQPHAFREYHGTERVELARDIEPSPIAYRNLFELGFIRPHPVDHRSVSLLLRYSLALSAWKQAGNNRWALRVNPSSGNLHPTEAYLVGESLTEPQQPTLYHYTSAAHALERRAIFATAVWQSLTVDLPAGSFLVGLTSILWREAWKYGERAFRYCQHDVGHALAALRFAAGMLGWQLRMATAWSTTDIRRLLGTDRHDDFRAEEHEEPELLLVIVPHQGEFKMADQPPSEHTLTAIRDSKWFGRANQLSAEDLHKGKCHPKIAGRLGELGRVSHYLSPPAGRSFAVLGDWGTGDSRRSADCQGAARGDREFRKLGAFRRCKRKEWTERREENGRTKFGHR